MASRPRRAARVRRGGAVLIAVAELALARCQCLVPVAELDDAGFARDGGSGADGGPGADGGGVDAGAATECTSWAACSRRDGGLAFCATTSTSCIDGRCVLECRPSPRTCTIADGGGVPCLTCSDSTGTNCGSCPRARICTMTPQANDCPGRVGGGQGFVVGSSSAACGGPLTPIDGGSVAGAWFDVLGGSVIWFPELGGWCTAQDLATGVPRSVIACPACSFVEVGCE